MHNILISFKHLQVSVFLKIHPQKTVHLHIAHIYNHNASRENATIIQSRASLITPPSRENMAVIHVRLFNDQNKVMN